MPAIRHPLSGAIYDLAPDQTSILVEKDGQTGRFDVDGRWLDGSIRTADPHLCNWIGGARMASRHRVVLEPKPA